MKMAKASPQEIENAHTLAALTENTCHARWGGYFPDDEKDFDEDNPEDLKRFYNEVKRLSSGLFRVTFGFETLLKNCCDPDKDYLEWKPEMLEFLNSKETDI